MAAHIAWWRDRADFPGGRAVVETLDACRTRWLLGTAPDAERAPATWRRWLGVADDSVAGLLTLHELLSDGEPLQWLDVLADDDEYAYGQAQTDHGDGYDWRRPDTTSRAALGLRSRCDASDLHAAALLTDPIYRRRAVHTGHVVTGTAHPLAGKLRRIEVTAARLDARLRPGNDVHGWSGPPASSGPAFSATIASATVRAGRLVLTLSGTTGTGAPSDGATVTLIPPAAVHLPPAPGTAHLPRALQRPTLVADHRPHPDRYPPSGAGKTRLVALLAATLARRADLRVGVAAQTRDQAAEIARRLGALDCPARLVWPAKHSHHDLGPRHRERRGRTVSALPDLGRRGDRGNYGPLDLHRPADARL